MDFVVSEDFTTPHIIMTGNPRQPTKNMPKAFKRGTVIQGDIIKDKNGRPLFVLVYPDLHIPLVYLRSVKTEPLMGGPRSGPVSNVSGPQISVSQPAATTAKVSFINNKKTKYIDFAIVGAILGFGVHYFAQKKEWVSSDNPNLRWYFVGGMAAAGVYVAYRMQAAEMIKNNKVTVKQ